MNNISDKIKPLAKLGYVSRGVIYLMIGGLAILTAFGSAGGKTSTSKGAMVELYQQPLGTTMLILLIIGLVGYSIWRFVQSIFDVDDHGSSAKGLAVRGALLISSVTHIFLAFWGVKFLMGSSDQSSSSSQPSYLAESNLWTAIFIVGAIFVLVAGIAHIYKGWTKGFEKYMNIPRDKAQVIVPICRIGLIARGVAWIILATILFQSASGASSGDLKNMSDVLETVRSADFGSYILAALAAGLFAFGIYSVSEALYRRVDANFA